MSEVKIEEEIETVSPDYLEFSNGTKLPLEEIKGINYLKDFQVDTNGNPSFSPKYNAEKGKPVAVVDNPKVYEDLVKEIDETSASQFPKNNINKQFVNIVETIVNVWQRKYPQFKFIAYSTYRNIGVDPKTVRKYLSVGAQAGLLDKSAVEKDGKFPHGTPSKRKPRLDPDTQQHYEKFTEWFETDQIQKWFKAKATARKGFTAKKDAKGIYQGGFGTAGKLFKIMKIMQISPEELGSYADRYGQVEGLEKLKARLEKRVWKDPRTMKNFGEDTFEDRRWSIYDWATSPKAPDPDYKITKAGKYKGKVRAIQSAKTAHNTWYDFAGIIIQYVKELGLQVPDQDPDSILAQVANKPKYAKIHLTVDQMEKMKRCIQTGTTGHLPKIQNIKVQITDYATEKKAVILEPNKFFELDESYWRDAYFYFLLSLEMGFRAEEALTIIAEEVEEDSDNSGLIFYSKKGNPVSFAEYEKGGAIQVQIYTRKSEKPSQAGQGTRIHAGFIQAPECKELIVKRYEEVQAGMQSKDPAKYGIIKELNGQVYTEHALIGIDGRYTKAGTLNLPSDAYQTEEEEKEIGKKGTVREKKDGRDKMRAMMKHCYRHVGLTKPYWFERALHALRHVFAQYWLTLSDYNYGFVAIVGHWKTESIVREVYGKQRGGDINRLQRIFSTGEKGDKTPFEILREKEEQQALISATEQKRSEMMHPDIATRLQEDQELRDKIFNEGGEYGGKMYERGSTPKSIVKEREVDTKIVEGSA